MLPKEYFTDKELSCSCRCGAILCRETTERFYALRILYGKPIPISSAARCKIYNRAIGSKDDSRHVLLHAGDCDIPLEDEYEFIYKAQLVGFTGIGIDDNEFIHLDDLRDNPAIWTY